MANQLSPSRESPGAFEWSYRRANNLFACVRYHKPVGVTRHFQMMFILDKFTRVAKCDVAERAVPVSFETFKPKADFEALSADTIWNYMDTLYDLETLNVNEEVPAEFETESEFSIDQNPSLVSLLNRATYPRSSNVSHAVSVAAEASQHEQLAASATSTASATVGEADTLACVAPDSASYVPSLPAADDGRSVASSSLNAVSDTETRSGSKSKRAVEAKPHGSAQPKRSKKR